MVFCNDVLSRWVCSCKRLRFKTQEVLVEKQTELKKNDCWSLDRCRSLAVPRGNVPGLHEILLVLHSDMSSILRLW